MFLYLLYINIIYGNDYRRFVRYKIELPPVVELLVKKIPTLIFALSIWHNFISVYSGPQFYHLHYYQFVIRIK